jgi:hypothetical protein
LTFTWGFRIAPVAAASNNLEGADVKMRAEVLGLALLAFGMTAYGQNQPPNESQSTAPANQPAAAQHQGRGAGGDIGSGSGDVGKGAAKGAGNVAGGAGKGAADLATLHPVDAAGAVGTGAAKGGKNIAVGTVKGTGKIAKGTGKAIKKIF